MADLLSIGLSGLAASKTQLSITGHNITNVNTPGYTRQDATQATRSPQFSGAGYIGSGTSLVDVRRSYSEFLTSQLRSSTSLNSDVEAYKSQIDQLDSLLAGTTTGITPSLQKFFSALQTAAEDPANIPARQLVLAEAEGLARRFNTVYDRLSEQNNFTNKQMSAVTDQVNRLAGSIGSLNEAIAVAAANGKQPNDLLDARDEAVRQLSGYIGVTVVPQDDSSFNIFIGSGQPLVVGSAVAKLEVVPGQGDPNRHEVQFISGGSRQGITSQITGGELGGLIRYREEVLDSTMNSLGRLSLAVSDQVNTQLGQGLDLKGQVGSALFGNYNDPALAKLRVNAFAGNSNAQPVLNITDTSVLTTSDYLMEYDASGPKVRRLSDNQLMTVTDTTPPTGVLTITDKNGVDQGFQVVLGNPAPAVGDKFSLQPTRRGAADIKATLDQADQLAFAAPVRAESNLQNAGTGAIGQPDMTSGPSPISISALQGLFGSNGATLTFTEPGTVTITGGTAQFRTVDDSTTPPTVSYSSTATIQPGQSNSLVVGDANYQFEFSLSGTPKDNDRFAMAFNQSGVSDNRNALKLVDLQTKQTVGVSANVAGSGFSFTDGYGELVERVGTLTAQARMDSEATGSILKQATDNRDSLSAVNLDEEAANLIKFEQYYNASAQIIQVARSLFDTLISSFR
ncbi:flagellar hook-associated protein FlgK [Pseudomonas stutzeri]|jgi:flagellar hook-associated protein 1 FlgK|uniref:Flagellar hook-associated protein 1 n=2 Tax=Stutzerimonas stutzeri TaxID=316 RepID=A0A0D7EBS3_STUST|nr:flagellar hook-associated protein FlgK [Stutzerimonas stutzeri]MBS69864.1 flagellar hook-associated protein FlgK [Pseudomonas sp.]EMD99805.1 flagellar hook-associated protein FlgK [Stutzerimonas stutzeri NF13]KIZ37022.1 flagellar hook protein FlgK [Stutzerimonas stutzeri]MBK3880582.1 flagellar hook-associated protein FlgK [Stutzerimonas stutzeri]MCQ4291987.1 flagellar hook-associated protein FlgK [Stutzerimonas stutzeri]